MIFDTVFTKQAKVKFPIICGAMYPCSNPELVAAVSEAGALGVVQPLSLTYVHGYNFKEGLDYIQSMTSKPFAMNILVEQASKVYEKRMHEVIDIALEKGCRFFITALGNPEWVVKKVKEKSGFVYHDATELKWAEKALKHGVDGIICVNNSAGGHAGTQSAEALFKELKPLGVPLICAGGISTREDFLKMLDLGYAGIQMGTRFIATEECKEKLSYKQAIVHASKKDIVLTKRVTGIPLSVINTPYVQKMGTDVNAFAKYLLLHRWTKKYMRLWYAYWAMKDFKKITMHGHTVKDYWQAGKSVEGIHAVKKVSEIIEEFVKLSKK